MMIHTEIQRIWITRIVELGNYLGGTVPPKSAKLFLPKIFSVKRGWGYPPIPQKKHRQNNSFFLQEHVLSLLPPNFSGRQIFPKGRKGGGLLTIWQWPLHSILRSIHKMVDYTDLVTKQHLIAHDTKNFYSNGVESIEHISWRGADCMQVLEDVQESEASLPSPSKRSPQVNKVGGGLSQIQLPTSWEIYYMQLKKHIDHVQVSGDPQVVELQFRTRAASAGQQAKAHVSQV